MRNEYFEVKEDPYLVIPETFVEEFRKLAPASGKVEILIGAVYEESAEDIGLQDVVGAIIKAAQMSGFCAEREIIAVNAYIMRNKDPKVCVTITRQAGDLG